MRLGADPAHLDVHLQGGDPGAGAGDLEVHVAVVVLLARDVGEDLVPVAVHHEAHGDARHRALDRHPGVHQGEGAAADGGHRGRAVRLEDVRDDADRVGEGLLGGQHLPQRPLGEDAVADLAAAGAAEELHLPDREGREVVVEHEALAVLGLLHGVDDLRVLGGAQGGGHQGLGLAAGEERRAVGARQDAHLGGDRPHLVEPPAVEAMAVPEDLALEQLLAQPVVDGRRTRPSSPAGPRGWTRRTRPSPSSSGRRTRSCP